MKNPKRVVSKIGAAILAASMMTAMAVPAMAATTYTPVTGSETTFNKYLIMDAGDSVPNATFNFTIAPGEAISASDGKMAVLAGIGTPTISTGAVFSPSDSTIPVKDNNGTLVVDNESSTSISDVDVQRTSRSRTNVVLEAGEKYAKKTVTVDFSSVQFREPGVYRYIITEAADDENHTHENAGIVHDDDNTRVLDVYVTDSNNGQNTLSVAGYVLHTDASTVEASANAGSVGGRVADKTDGFTNEMSGRKDLEINKAVSGNQASRDKYFEVTATLTNVADTDTFVVSLADDSNANTNDGNADATSGNNAATIAANAGKTNPTSVTGAQLKAGQKFYLQGGQKVVIRGLPLNAKYTITENAEDYKSAATTGMTNTTGDGTIGTVAEANTQNTKLAVAGFTNTRDGVIPTGVMMAVAPFAVATLIGGAGVATMTMKKRKKEDE